MRSAAQTISGLLRIDATRFTLPRLPLGAAKTATYSLMHLVVAMSVAYGLTGSWKAALAIGMIEPAMQTIAYTLHEKAWRRAAPRINAAAPACGHPHLA